MENLQSKNFISYIEIVNKVALKENFRTFHHEDAQGHGDYDFEAKAFNN